VRWPPDWELAVRHSPVNREVNREAEEATALKAIIRRQPVKLQVPEKSCCVLERIVECLNLRHRYSYLYS
jgi:hypothetical protein